ncbi:hypothetical protein Patl1_04161 [Pistacia atlantica]|uniref:Uncharacterized protein n=1 Tax=Pistacia atlantica TaxID=434234 RepID=A0ACC1BQ92_9ROSI|nr:hypothetical protein Patl1_04161 [Pistacia atlantica]
MGFLMFQAHETRILDLPILSTISRASLRIGAGSTMSLQKHMTLQRWDERVNKAILLPIKRPIRRVASVKAVQNQRHHSDSDDMPTLDP